MIKGYSSKEDFNDFLKDFLDVLYSGSYSELGGDVHDIDDLLIVPPMFEKYITKGNIQELMNLVSSLHLSLEEAQESYFKLLDLLRDESYLIEDKSGNLKVNEKE